MNIAGSGVLVVAADEGRHFLEFIEVPYRIQGGNRYWVPPLRLQQRDLLDRVKNPFYRHAEIRLFVAYRAGRAVGRIAAISNQVHNDTHHERATLWGFFECIDDLEAASALFGAVEAAARSWGHTLLRGPFNPSVNDEIGLQIDAFDQPGYVMIPYNPAWYVPLVEAQGFVKSVDLYCFRIDSASVSERLKRVGPAVASRGGVRYRRLTKASLKRDVDKIWAIYNSAWERNWLWVHATREEFAHLVDNLVQIADFDLAWIAETADGEMVGFSVAVPNINEALISIRDGRLAPFGWARLLWASRPGAIHSLRFMVMGVLTPWRGHGIDLALNYHQFVEAGRKGYERGEMSQILETNLPMIHAAEALGGERYKTHRMYEKSLPAT